MRRLVLLPYTFVLMNWAAMKALYCYLRGSAVDGLWNDHPAVLPSGRRA
jgi:hypothetical protein